MSDNNPYGLPPVPPPPNPYSGQPQANPFGSPPPNPYANPYNQGVYAPPGAPAPQPPNPFANPYNQGGYSPPQQPPTGGGFNPYAPPSFDAQGPAWAQSFGNEQVLATPGTRLVARILDNLLFFAAMLPAVIGAAANSDDLAIGLGSLGVLALAIYQWYLASTTGQSLGKKWMGVRIVKMDGSSVDFVSAVLLRSWVMQILTFIGGFIVIGSFLPLIDALMIFGDGHRCLHDHIAGTKVVIA